MNYTEVMKKLKAMGTVQNLGCSRLHPEGKGTQNVLTDRN